MSKKIHFFNMIEILLALTVIAIGMTSVLGLFPVGLNASREAIAQNCSADVADQMVTYMRVMGESSNDAYNKTFDYNDTLSTDLPDHTGLDIKEVGDTITIDLNSGVDFVDATDVDVQSLGDAFLAEYKSGTFTDYPRVAPGWAIFAPKLKSTEPNVRRRIYFIVQGPNCTEDGGNRSIDYSAMALVWKEPVQIRRLKSGGNPSVSTDWTLWPNPASYVYSAKIHVELSWPLELPYSQRQKRYYQVVINKPD